MIYSGHRGCLAGRIVLQGRAKEKRTPSGSDYVYENKKKRVVLLQTIIFYTSTVYIVRYNDKSFIGRW